VPGGARRDSYSIQAFDLFGLYEKLYIEKGVKEGFLRENILVEETALAINAMIFEGARRTMLAKNKSKAKRSWVRAVMELMLQGIQKPVK
jgi:hypothetical protein